MKSDAADSQLTLRFEAGLSDAWETCREFVAHRAHHQGRQMKSIAADLDLSPSHLTRKLAQSPDDSSRFTLDDLERFIQTTGDTSPILYLVEKYMSDAKERELDMLRKRIAQLERGAA